MALFLVIDEDRDSCTLLRRVLARQGHRVAAFTRTEEAVQWLQENTPDLTIASTGNYGEGAGRVLEALKKAGLRSSEIVLNTNSGSLGEVKRTYAGQVREILVKASDFEKLETLLGAS